VKTTLSDFKPLNPPRALLDGKRFAQVTVTTERGWWRWRTVTTETRMVFQEGPCGGWRWLYDGAPTPGYQVENLASEWRREFARSTYAAHPVA